MRSAWLVALLVLGACKGKSTPAQRDAAPAAPADAANNIDASVDAAAKAARSEHAVWKLVDNRHTAHRAVDTELVLDARAYSFARYTRFDSLPVQWKLALDVGGELGAIPERLAALEVPIIPEQPAPTQITARVFSTGPKQAIEVRVNGRKPAKARVPLEPGWQTVALALEAGMMPPGENVVAIETVGGNKKLRIGLSWLRFGASHPPADQDPLAAASFDATGDAIELADRASLTWYVTLPEGAHLVADVAAPCLLEVGARAGDASFVGGLLGHDQDRVDLSAIAGKAVRLSLTARDCPRARIGHPRITIHGPEPTPLPKADPPRNVVMWSTWNVLKEPAFQELAKSSVVFRQYAGEVNSIIEIDAAMRPTKLPWVLWHEADAVRDKPMFILVPSHEDLEKIIAKLKSWGVWDQTMLVISDGTTLLIRDLARYPGGTIVDEGAESVDVIPSIFDALGLPPPGQGMPLAPLAQGIGRGWQRPSYTYSLYPHEHQMRLGRWQIRLGSLAAPIVNEFVGEPGEREDLAVVRPIERRMLTDALGLFLRQRGSWKKAEWGVVTNLTAAGAKALDARAP